jgi:HEAT repeat protein
MRRHNLVWWTATTVAAAVLHTGSQPSPAWQQVTGSAASASVEETDISALAATLADPAAAQALREQAARRLASRRSADATQILLSALLEPNPGGQLAVAKALADEPAHDPAFINPLFATLGTNNALTDAAARALSGYKSSPQVLTRLIRFATENRARGVERTRIAVIRAIGGFPERRAAETLIALMREPDSTVGVRHAATDALAALTGISEFGTDAQRWEQWWSVNATGNDADFRNEILGRKAQELDRLRARNAQLAAGWNATLDELYQLTPLPQKEQVLLRALRREEPEARSWAARQIYDDLTESRPVGDAVRTHLRTMIGDSSATVRAAAVRAVGALNDEQALESLLRQVANETDPNVRAAVAEAFRNIRDVRAAPALLRLLEDDSRAVARSAAQALKELGGRLAEQNPELARRAAESLRAIIERRANTPADADLRDAAVEALAPLRQRDFTMLFVQLLHPRESPRVKIAALRGLTELRDKNPTDRIVELIGDADDTVAIEAVRALRAIGATPEQLEALRPLLEAGNRADPSVNNEAWQTLEPALPELSKELLVRWAGRFGNDPVRQIIVLKALAARLTSDKELEDLADVQQQIADLSMRLRPPDVETAVANYRAALLYRQDNPGAWPGLPTLRESYLRALLQARRYAEAIAFASETLTRDASQQSSIGRTIRQWVDDLSNSDQPDDLRSAQQLVKQAVAMTPPLAQRYQDDLNALAVKVDTRLAELSAPKSPTTGQAPGTPGTGPRSASGEQAPGAARPSVSDTGDR